MGAEVYVVAVLGTSGAVLTELLWALLHEGAVLKGIEVWTTHDDLAGLSPGGRPQTGCQALQELLLTQGAWRQLSEAWGGRLPPLAERGGRIEARGGQPHEPPARGLAVRWFVREGRPLADIRDRGDVEVVAQTLHDRIRHLSETLPAEVQLVGSLAGGRKTMSAALQTAFALQARVGDRLVHVLMAPALEDHQRDFVFPHARWVEQSGVALGEQVELVEVPFPSLRALVEQRLPLGEALAHGSYAEIWGSLGVNRGATARGRLRIGLPKPRLVIEGPGGEVLDEVPLSKGQARLYGALVTLSLSLRGPVTHEALQAALGLKIEGKSHEDNTTRQAVSALRKKTEGLRFKGLGGFSPGVDPLVISWAERIDLED